jgi:hypothetical protein
MTFLLKSLLLLPSLLMVAGSMFAIVFLFRGRRPRLIHGINAEAFVLGSLSVGKLDAPGIVAVFTTIDG